VSGALPSAMSEAAHLPVSRGDVVDGSAPLTSATPAGRRVKGSALAASVPEDPGFYTLLAAATIPGIEALIREREPDIAKLIRERDGWFR